MVTLTNARVFDGTQLLPGTHDVSLRGRRIAAVDVAGAGPQDEVIDLHGMTLLPGLITSHLHPDFYKYELTSGLRPGLERPPGVMMAIGVRTCRVLLESGFTGYSGAACAHDIDAQLKMAISEGIIPGPRIRACGHHIGTTGDVNNQDAWWRRPDFAGVDLAADGPTELRHLVRDEIRRGVETIKIFASAGHGIPGPNRRNLSRDEIAAVVDTAHERGAKVRAHVTDRAMILECLDLGVDVIDHGDDIDGECIERMAEAGTFWVPSLVYPWSLLEIGYAPHFGVTREAFDHVKEMLPIAHEAGVRILIGDDYSGVLRHLIEDDPLDHEVGNYGRELRLLRRDRRPVSDRRPHLGDQERRRAAGGPARSGRRDRTGALADLIVVDGDPLSDLTLLARPDEALRAVIRDGSFAINRLPATQGAPT